MNTLERRIIELSYRYKMSHVSSALNCVNVLDDIYRRRSSCDPVVLGNSHGSLGLYVVLESRGITDAEELLKKHGTHASRDMDNGIWVSGGSLGQAETIAVGMALADRNRNVWLVTSDGACAEGAVWEAFALASDQALSNFYVDVVANGWGAYREINVKQLEKRLTAFLPPFRFKIHRPTMPFPWLEELAGHYLVLNDQQFQEAMA